MEVLDGENMEVKPGKVEETCEYALSATADGSTKVQIIKISLFIYVEQCVQAKRKWMILQ